MSLLRYLGGYNRKRDRRRMLSKQQKWHSCSKLAHYNLGNIPTSEDEFATLRSHRPVITPTKWMNNEADIRGEHARRLDGNNNPVVTSSDETENSMVFAPSRRRLRLAAPPPLEIRERRRDAWRSECDLESMLRVTHFPRRRTDERRMSVNSDDQEERRGRCEREQVEVSGGPTSLFLERDFGPQRYVGKKVCLQIGR